MLGERVDRYERFECLGQYPVGGQLVGVQLCPFAYETQRPRRQRPVEDFERVELDLSDVLAVLGVKSALEGDRGDTCRSRSRRRPIGEARGRLSIITRQLRRQAPA